MADRTRSRKSLVGSIIAIATIALLLASCGGSSGNSSNGDGNGNGEEAPVNEAQAIFVEVGCAECHGEQGEGIDGKARSLQGTRMIIDQFSTRVRNGRGQSMPGYTAEQISDEQILLIQQWLAGQ